MKSISFVFPAPRIPLTFFSSSISMSKRSKLASRRASTSTPISTASAVASAVVPAVAATASCLRLGTDVLVHTCTFLDTRSHARLARTCHDLRTKLTLDLQSEQPSPGLARLRYLRLVSYNEHKRLRSVAEYKSFDYPELTSIVRLMARAPLLENFQVCERQKAMEPTENVHWPPLTRHLRHVHLGIVGFMDEFDMIDIIRPCAATLQSFVNDAKCVHTGRSLPIRRLFDDLTGKMFPAPVFPCLVSVELWLEDTNPGCTTASWLLRNTPELRRLVLRTRGNRFHQLVPVERLSKLRSLHIIGRDFSLGVRPPTTNVDTLDLTGFPLLEELAVKHYDEYRRAFTLAAEYKLPATLTRLHMNNMCYVSEGIWGLSSLRYLEMGFGFGAHRHTMQFEDVAKHMPLLEVFVLQVRCLRQHLTDLDGIRTWVDGCSKTQDLVHLQRVTLHVQDHAQGHAQVDSPSQPCCDDLTNVIPDMDRIGLARPALQFHLRVCCSRFYCGPLPPPPFVPDINNWTPFCVPMSRTF